MSSTRSVRTLAGVALASSVILLGGCASTGTTGASTSARGNSTSSAASGGSSTGGSTSGGSIGGLSTDAGCQAAQSDISNGDSALMNAASDPKGAQSTLTSIAGKLHADAAKSSKASSQINKLGDDFANLANALNTGQVPDSGSLLTDGTAVQTACQG